MCINIAVSVRDTDAYLLAPTWLQPTSTCLMPPSTRTTYAASMSAFITQPPLGKDTRKARLSEKGRISTVGRRDSRVDSDWHSNEITPEAASRKRGMATAHSQQSIDSRSQQMWLLHTVFRNMDPDAHPPRGLEAD